VLFPGEFQTGKMHQLWVVPEVMPDVSAFAQEEVAIASGIRNISLYDSSSCVLRQVLMHQDGIKLGKAGIIEHLPFPNYYNSYTIAP